MGSDLFDFAVTTIFAREVLEGSIIIGEYRIIVLRGEKLQAGVRKEDALREITLSALFATALALLVIAAIAIPLAVLSSTFNSKASNIIEGISKIVASICLLGLSLKLPKFLGVYGSTKHRDDDGEENEENLTIRSIRFNVAWNIWREVAECGVFLIPFFLSGEGLKAIPLSALIGSIVGLLCGIGIYWANKRFTNKVGLAIFSCVLLVILSAGLFSGGCHRMEQELGMTTQVWEIKGELWSARRLPMTIVKPFGYTDSRTLLQLLSFWGWLGLSALLHYRKYRRSPKIPQRLMTMQSSGDDAESSLQDGTVEIGESSLEDVEVEAYSGRSSLGAGMSSTSLDGGSDDCTLPVEAQVGLSSLGAGVSTTSLDGEPDECTLP